MKSKKVLGINRKLIVVAAGVAIGSILCGAGNLCHAQTQPVSLPPGVQDVVKLAHAGLSDEIILTQIKSTGAMYNLTADQIIYLSSQGVSQPVIKALLPANAAVPATPPPAVSPGMAVSPPAAIAPGIPGAPAVPAANYDSFHSQLAPYGSWIQSDVYGSCWRPSVASDPAWRPYCDQGHWIYTDSGWSWQSDYPWGNIAFHYGRWYRGDLGWVWVPGYDWAPAWVSWRRTDRYCGWAPLPPAAVFKAGVGLTFGGAVVVDADFGLTTDAFTFIGYDHFWDHDFRPYLLPRDRVEVVFRDSHVMNGYRMDHGRFIVEGLGRDSMATLTHHEVVVEVPGHDVRRLEEDRGIRRGDHPDNRRPDDRRDH